MIFDLIRLDGLKRKAAGLPTTGGGVPSKRTGLPGQQKSQGNPSQCIGADSSPKLSIQTSPRHMSGMWSPWRIPASRLER